MFRGVVERLLRYPEQRHRGLRAQARTRLARLDPDPDPGALRVLLAVPRKRRGETVLVEQRGPELGHDVLDRLQCRVDQLQRVLEPAPGGLVLELPEQDV